MQRNTVNNLHPSSFRPPWGRLWHLLFYWSDHLLTVNEIRVSQRNKGAKKNPLLYAPQCQNAELSEWPCYSSQLSGSTPPACDLGEFSATVEGVFRCMIQLPAGAQLCAWCCALTQFHFVSSRQPVGYINGLYYHLSSLIKLRSSCI